jgi:hypothetical protein
MLPAMQDKDREKRRTRRLEKQKKKRSTVSRPGAGGPTVQFDVAKGRSWDTGECYVSEDWDEPGSKVDLVFSRSRPDGTSVAAVFELDRSGPGLVACRSVGGLRREHVVGECARISDRTGRSMVGCAPALVVALVKDARAHGTRADPPGLKDAYGLLDGIAPLELTVPFGPAETEPATPKAEGGWLQGLRKRLFGG